MRTHAVRFTTTHGVCGIQMCFPLAGRDSNYLPCGGAMHRPPMRFLASGQLGTDKQRASFFGRFPPKTVSVIGKCLFCFPTTTQLTHATLLRIPSPVFLLLCFNNQKKGSFLFLLYCNYFLWGPNMLHSSIQYTTQVIGSAEYQSERERRRGRRRGDNLSSPPPPPPPGAP